MQSVGDVIKYDLVQPEQERVISGSDFVARRGPFIGKTDLPLALLC